MMPLKRGAAGRKWANKKGIQGQLTPDSSVEPKDQTPSTNDTDYDLDDGGSYAKNSD